MSRKKRKLREIEPARRKRNEFTRALSAAKKSLAAKTRERDRALNLLRDLNLDIPNLERTVRALEQQLGGTGAVRPLTSQPDNKQVGGVPPLFTAEQRKVLDEKYYGPVLENNPELKDIAEIPPEIRAQLPPEDFSKFGSHYGTAQEEDTLPEITGKPLIPETK
jgi:hypothetical protein